MKKDLKKILAVLLALVMVFGLFACGKKQEEEPPNPPEEQQEEQGDGSPAPCFVVRLRISGRKHVLRVSLSLMPGRIQRNLHHILYYRDPHRKKCCWSRSEYYSQNILLPG